MVAQGLSECLRMAATTINISFDYVSGIFPSLDERQQLTGAVDDVIVWILWQLEAIPAIRGRIPKPPPRRSNAH